MICVRYIKYVSGYPSELIPNSVQTAANGQNIISIGAVQLITQIWKLIYGQWVHRSRLKHAGKALEEHTKELILRR